jgi:rhodanese-related sulfurtransferase
MPPEAATATTTVVNVPEISRDDFKRGQKAHAFKIIDVLPAESYANGHIPGALSMPVPEIAALAPRLLPDLNEAIVAYCGKFT